MVDLARCTGSGTILFMPFVLHAAWLRSDEPVPDGQLFFWAADSSTPLSTDAPAISAQPPTARSSYTRSPKAPSHPTQLSVGQLRSQLFMAFPSLQSAKLKLSSTTIWLPEQLGSPFAVAAPNRAKLGSHPATDKPVNGSAATASPMHVGPNNGKNGDGETGQGAPSTQPHGGWRQWQITGLLLPPIAALQFLAQLEHSAEQGTQPSDGRRRATEQVVSSRNFVPWRFGNDLLFWSNAAKYTLQILAQQQYLPTILPQSATQLYAGWQPILADSQLEHQFDQLGTIMPPACRAYAIPSPADAPGALELLNHFITTLLDSAVRTWGERLLPAVAPATQAQQWFHSLVSPQRAFDLPPQSAHQLYQVWRSWSEQLHIIRDANFRICFQLEPPTAVANVAATEGNWTLRYYLQARDHRQLRLAASEVWEAQNHALHLGARLLDRPQERLLAGLTVAARISPPIARSLQTPQPALVHLSTAEAYTFLHETAALLESSGFGVQLPDWWYTNQRVRLGLRMNMMAEQGLNEPGGRGARKAEHMRGSPSRRNIGFVRYDWELMLGDKLLDRDEFERLAALDSPLVHLQGQWIELDPSQVAAAKQFLAEQQTGGRLPLLQALRIAQRHLSQADVGLSTAETADDERIAALLPQMNGADTHSDLLINDLLSANLSASVTGLLPIQRIDLQGWLAQALDRLHDQQPLQALSEPAGFVGELRPYQRRGVGWLHYLGELGLGACLADDMGLGKTIQAIALLLHQRATNPEEHLVSLLLCPTSVVANWRHEVERFAPSLRVLVHHGSGRLEGEAFADALAECNLVITSYGTARRDMELLGTVFWHNLILDEAQNIKNPGAKQTKAVRQFQANNRLALTGTPVENRLSELWSIIEFLNPGYLSGYEQFRRRYIIPIERYNDDQRARELRNLVQPFLLRRLKSDPTIIADLPEKNEMVVYCSLTQEQAALYEKVVSASLSALDTSDGIQRRGMVLALLTKLKQICNHPAHFLKEEGPVAGRSGKVNRVMEMMEEVIAIGDSALVFTQFVEMGELLQKHFTEHLKADVLFLHGRTTAAQRERMVATFQAAETPTIFILSLRAGGSGLNLTKANHVFHFDRWWNPAVENQATDRAFRIGQRRDVQVHKFVVAGTLEEHIQQLLDDKQNLADTIVGNGEQWLSELNTEQLRELLVLRQDAQMVTDAQATDDD